MNKNRYGKNIGEKHKPYPSIALKYILSLRLSEIETAHVIEYLGEKGIRVVGRSQNFDSEFDLYDNIENFSTYIDKQIKKMYPDKLSNKEMYEKFIKYYRTKDKDLREELILRNSGFVPYVIKNMVYRYDHISFDDLRQYGYEGLIHGIDNFNPFHSDKKSEHVGYQSYLIKYISGFIKKNIAKDHQKSLIRLPKGLYDSFSKAKNIVEKRTGEELKNNPDLLEEIVDLMIANENYPEKNKYMYMNALADMLSLDKVEEELESDYNLEDEALFSFTKEELLDVLDELTERERKVLKLRFGLEGNRPRTLEETAREINATRERVRQIEVKALRKLKHPSRIRKIM